MPPHGGCDGGIIPAHAGFTRRQGPAGSGGQDHPRTRGVYYCRLVEAATIWGSSPHTRGLPRPGHGAHRRLGIIPAHAGFTPSCDRCHVTATDHPRTRGVYDHTHHGVCHILGSSPHTRGLPVCVAACVRASGIIPAHAGFTPRRPGRPGRPRDHPRTRGVYVGISLTRVIAPGSSPHTRGLQAVGVAVGHRGRIIPAHAGFTPRHGAARPRRRDHPRTRGVYREALTRSASICGSSPHTRGLRMSRM